MLQTEYKSGQLIEAIELLSEQKYTGVLNLCTNIAADRQPRYCSLVLRDGQVLYADSQIITNEQFCKKLGDKINPSAIDAALLVIKQRTAATESFQKFVDLSVRIKVFTWQDVVKFVCQAIVQNIEVFAAYPGTIEYQEFGSFDLFLEHLPEDLKWSNIKQKIELRQQQWERFEPDIPSMDAIPVVDRDSLSEISDSKVRQHLDKMVNGKRNLLDIAASIGKDPLKVAKTYSNWCADGWVRFVPATFSQTNLPIVLSVDDSPIIQTMISRALKEVCNVHLADKATTAMEILNSQPVKLLLLDLTMPDVDGLEFCQTVRKMPQFSDLPIVMVTARDGLVNRAKGRLAGTNRYLTKPFKPEELREIVDRYVG